MSAMSLNPRCSWPSSVASNTSIRAPGLPPASSSISQLTDRIGASIAVTSSQPAAMLTTIPPTPMKPRISASRDAGTPLPPTACTASTTSPVMGKPIATTQIPTSRARIPIYGRAGAGPTLNAIAVRGRSEISATR